MKKHIPVFALLLFSFSVFGQSSKKESLECSRVLLHTDTNEIIKGEKLHLANELSIGSFVNYYLINGKTRQLIKYGTLSLRKIYADSEFTYFIRSNTYYIVRFIKVNTKDFAQLDLAKLDRDQFENRFIREVVPLSDKEKVKRREPQNMSKTETRDFKYIYHENENEIQITYKWKVTGNYTRIIKRTYRALYDFKNDIFIKNE